MKFRPFTLRCECGLTSARIKQVGLSPDHQLVIHWWCLRCKKAIYVVKDLTECWKDTPAPEEVEDTVDVRSETDCHRRDERFLHSLGVRFPSDNES